METLWLVLISVGVLVLIWLNMAERLDRAPDDSTYRIVRYPVYGYPINMTSGTTRNMSYDLRGDPYIPRRFVGPFSQATVYPIRNRQMIIGN